MYCFNRTFATVLNSTLVTLAASLLWAGNAQAASLSDDSDWQLRLTGVVATSTGGGGLESDLGAALGVEYRIHDRFGIELSVIDANVESDVSFEFGPFATSIESSVGFQPVLLAGNIYLTPGRRAELFISPMIGYASIDSVDVSVDTSDFGFGGSTRVSSTPAEDQFVFGLRIGLDLRLTDHFMLTGSLSHLQVPLELTESTPDEHGDLDPLIAQLGIGFRF